MNAILILVAAAAITLGAASIWWMESTAYDTPTTPVLGVQDPDQRLSLAPMTLVAGSNVIRQELVERDASVTFSSGSSGYGKTLERERKYVLAVFDPASLEKKSEQELTLPALK